MAQPLGQRRPRQTDVRRRLLADSDTQHKSPGGRRGIELDTFVERGLHAAYAVVFAENADRFRRVGTAAWRVFEAPVGNPAINTDRA
jgi:hypothetical protein